MSVATIATPAPAAVPVNLRPFAVTVPAAKLRAALTKVAPAVGHRLQVTPIILGVRLQVTNGDVTATCTNLDAAATTTITDAVPTASPAAVVVNLKLLRQILARVTGDVTLTEVDDELNINVGGGTIRVRTMPAGDWPRTPTVDHGDTFPLYPWHLAGLLNAASDDPGRPILTGLRLNKGAMATTDSYRLHWVTKAVPDYPPLTIPARFLRWVTQLPAPAQLTVPADDDTMHVKVEGGGQTWVIRTVEGNYVDWRPLTKLVAANKQTVNRAALVDAIAHARRIPFPASWSPPPIILEVGTGKVTLTRKIQDVGVTETTIDATGGTPEGTVVGLNVDYFADAVNAGTGDTITVHIGDPIKPVFITDGSPIRRLLMPVRIA